MIREESSHRSQTEPDECKTEETKSIKMNGKRKTGGQQKQRTKRQVQKQEGKRQ